MKYPSGSLVSVRGRDWVVQPASTDALLIVKPLDGNDDETTGILMALEGDQVKQATFALPTVGELGDTRSCRLLRDALRIGVRSSAGPFRSFGRIAVEPRPYQLVPLMMGLKLNPVRLLIADDVGIGKTIESCLLARELIDRGECQGLCVVCPPHLAEQWQAELRDKFHIDAKLVLSSTVKQLETACLQTESIFEVFPYTVVSIDFIKSDRRREDFLRAAPDFIIVDEAHAASNDINGSSRHQRHDLVRRLCEVSDRHIVLVTATPHSGNEGAFRSLLGLLRKEFLDYPDDMSGDKNRKYRQEIAKHFVQRRRADIEYFLEDKTEFPKPLYSERQYTLTEDYRRMFDHALEYTRELVFDKKLKLHHQRVRWWSALALLRALASSPAAAVATLKNRSIAVDAATVEEVNIIGQKMVFDLDHASVDASDLILGNGIEEDGAEIKLTRSHSAILKQLADEAEQLCGEKDNKMLQLAANLKKLIKDGFHPIVFCRFIQTAEYLAAELRKRIPKTEIYDVTGLLPPDERQRRVQELAEHEKRVLVCTDCLSEGINLQEHFDAVIHYDLSWNPTRHEQREGRVDRFGQPKDTLRMITYYGADNIIDGVVLDVLLRKHKKIKDSLGISVPVPSDTQAIVETIFSSLLHRQTKETVSKQQKFQEISDFLDDEAKRKINDLYDDWDEAGRNEKRSRTVFAQERLAKQVEDVQRELVSVQETLGSVRNVADFAFEVLRGAKAIVKPLEGATVHEIDFQTATPIFRDYCNTFLQQRSGGVTNQHKRLVRFALPVESGVEHLCRTHPLVESLADYVLNSALDAAVVAGNSKEQVRSIASRCGLIHTVAVRKRTTLLLLRYRFHLASQTAHRKEHRILAEDVQIVGFRGAPDEAEWIEDNNELDTLLNTAQSTRSVIPQTAKDRIQEVLDSLGELQPTINEYARQRAEQLKDAHQRVREITIGAAGPGTVEVQPELPPDLLGVYVYLPE